jgi:hypothetical protein
MNVNLPLPTDGRPNLNFFRVSWCRISRSLPALDPNLSPRPIEPEAGFIGEYKSTPIDVAMSDCPSQTSLFMFFFKLGHFCESTCPKTSFIYYLSNF